MSNFLGKGYLTGVVNLKLEITEQVIYCIIHVIIRNPVHFTYELEIVPARGQGVFG